VVYLKRGSTFEAHAVKIDRRTESQAVVEGVNEGTEVALVNPEDRGKKPSSSPGPSGPAAAGRPS
jgi:hypothetical protein